MISILSVFVCVDLNTSDVRFSLFEINYMLYNIIIMIAIIQFHLTDVNRLTIMYKYP